LNAKITGAVEPIDETDAAGRGLENSKMPTMIQEKEIDLSAEGTAPSPYTIEHWEPEDDVFWKTTGKRIATRNLIFSIFVEFLGFSVWQVWSAVSAQLPNVGYAFSVNELFWLAALPGLSGATLRIPYGLAVSMFGGRNWTLVSAALLLIPATGLAFAVQSLGTPYWVFLLLALVAGFGGGNFASSMANIQFFYPQKKKGVALGLNAAGGNIGVSVVQFIVPVVIASSLFGSFGGGAQIAHIKGVQKSLYLQNAALIWIPLILLALVTSWFFMNNLHVAKASLKQQLPILKNKHNWVMSWLYLGTFGSFIGYSAGFPLLIKSQFPGVNPLQYAFLGPLVGSVIRPVGGWLADKLGGAVVTFWNFLAMSAALSGVIYFLAHKTDPGAFTGFFAMFLLLFVCSGIGNGSTFRMIPIIFRTLRLRAQPGTKEGSATYQAAIKVANKESSTIIGFVSAMAAYGAFFVPKSYGTSISLTGSPVLALATFLAFYSSCLYITWFYYARKGAEVPC
jgi:NNP family nitrate/nitrite transporter-like MFS transporter